MLNTIVTIPVDKITGWHWLDKEHPFKLVSDRARVFYTGMCGETDYHFALVSRSDKEIVLQLKNIATPARKVTKPSPEYLLARQEPAVAGKGGHARLTEVCAQLRFDYPELSEERLLSALRGWNSRCAPPWSQDSLMGALRAAGPAQKKDKELSPLLKNMDLQRLLVEYEQCVSRLSSEVRDLRKENKLLQDQAPKPYPYQGAESGLPQTSSAPTVRRFAQMTAADIGLGLPGVNNGEELFVTFLSYDKEGTLRSFNAKTSPDAQLVYYFNVVSRTGEIKYVGYGVKA
jgi:hypothetical protein